jgi:hypothetical protein
MEFQDLCDSLKKFQIRKFSIMQGSTPIAMEQKKLFGYLGMERQSRLNYDYS